MLYLEGPNFYLGFSPSMVTHRPEATLGFISTAWSLLNLPSSNWLVTAGLSVSSNTPKLLWQKLLDHLSSSRSFLCMNVFFHGGMTSFHRARCSSRVCVGAVVVIDGMQQKDLFDDAYETVESLGKLWRSFFYELQRVATSSMKCSRS